MVSPRKAMNEIESYCRFCGLDPEDLEPWEWREIGKRIGVKGPVLKDWYYQVEYETDDD